eukprot:gnl/TRDRNA2_/TRDRNA2_124905_c1_seq1.p1 gnl/TRDRNA2_/TRDRNA2_124905_c1~~gnl/TRDRNA2_/TRDRNA2_124905_c1_seq1.p1  ORF type:complete len:389 (-),score=42.53 gnl/TRDRNA2_/TRDRNA2_124905_c1_seq1:66-1169(-)
MPSDNLSVTSAFMRSSSSTSSASRQQPQSASSLPAPEELPRASQKVAAAVTGTHAHYMNPTCGFTGSDEPPRLGTEQRSATESDSWWSPVGELATALAASCAELSHDEHVQMETWQEVAWMCEALVGMQKHLRAARSRTICLEHQCREYQERLQHMGVGAPGASSIEVSTTAVAPSELNLLASKASPISPEQILSSQILSSCSSSLQPQEGAPPTFVSHWPAAMTGPTYVTTPERALAHTQSAPWGQGNNSYSGVHVRVAPPPPGDMTVGQQASNKQILLHSTPCLTPRAGGVSSPQLSPYRPVPNGMTSSTTVVRQRSHPMSPISGAPVLRAYTPRSVVSVNTSPLRGGGMVSPARAGMKGAGRSS